MEKIVILGASRGLGRALVECIQQDQRESVLLLSSRRLDRLEELKRPQDVAVAADFSDLSGLNEMADRLKKFEPTRLFYIAGGGPFGPYGKKEWKDHQWAFHVNYLYPAKLLHHLLQNSSEFFNLKLFIAVGSQIAGDSPDPMAASYCGAKHGLNGLIASVKLESPPFAVDIFAPGYMDTELLPRNAWPRQKPEIISDPKEEALRLWQWSCSSIK